MNSLKSLKIFFIILVTIFCASANFPYTVRAQAENLTIMGISIPKLIVCGDKTDEATGKVANPCTVADAITTFKNAINFMFLLIVPASFVMFSYAGFLYIRSGIEGNPGMRSDANKIFKRTLIGILVMCLAWVVIKNLLDLVLDTKNFKVLGI